MKKLVSVLILLLLGVGIIIPAQSAFAQAGLDLNDYCRDKGWGRATLNGGDTAYDWKCQSGSTYLDMNLNEACQMQYGSGYSANFRDFNDPYSWYCEGSGGNNNQNNSSSSSSNQSSSNSSSSSSSNQSSSNSGSNTVTAVVTVCSSSYRTGIEVGDQARVTPGVANRIRSGAGTGYSQVGSAQPGVIFNIVGGPTCANGYKWWEINYGGIRGWTVEGDDSEAWIEVVSNSSNRCSVPLRAYNDSSRGGEILEIPLVPLPSSFTIYFEGRVVEDSNWGVRHNGFAGETSNGNTYLGIGRRWIHNLNQQNKNWDDDSLWFISYSC